MTLRVGTRRSALARAQTGIVRALIESRLGLATTEVLVTSRGDVDRTRPLHEATAAGPGLFTEALEDALRAGEIDVAVHSMKDLPLATPRELPIVAVPARADPADALVVAEGHYAPGLDFPVVPGARVGTSSPRRQTQLLAAAPEAVPTDVRGNVETRLGLIAKGVVDAVILAQAGLLRGGFAVPEGCRLVPLSLDRFPTCAGQGALAIQARAGTAEARQLVALDDAESRAAADAERALLAHLGGGCGMPLGATFTRGRDGWRVRATLASERWRADPSLTRFDAHGPDALALAKEAASRLVAPAAPLAPAPRNARLAGRSILFTFDEDAAAPFVAAVERQGGRAAAWPTTRHEPLPLAPLPRAVLDAWPRAQWVALASRRAVRAAVALAALPREGAPRFAAVGPATAREMRAAGLPVHVVSPDGTARSLAAAIARWTPPEGPVIAPGAAEPRADLSDVLRAANFDVVSWPAYRTLPSLAPSPFALPVDALVVTAPSAAAALPAGPLARRVVALGPVTAEALAARGILVHAVAPRPTPQAVLEVLS